MNIVTWSNHSFNYERMKRMENAVQIFDNAEFGQVRTVVINNEPYFVGKDVAEALGYAKPENAISNHVDDEDKTTTLIQGTGSNYKSNAVCINESGVYSLVFGSKLPTAKKFKGAVFNAKRKGDKYGQNEIMGGGPQKTHCLYRCRGRADLRGLSYLQAFPPAGASDNGKPNAG